MRLGFDLVHGFTQQPEIRLFLAHHALGHTRVVGDRGKRLIHLVGKTGGHLTHGGQTRGMSQLIALLLHQRPRFFQRSFALQFGGNVIEHHHGPVQFALIQLGCRPVLGGETSAVHTQHADVALVFGQALTAGGMHGQPVLTFLARGKMGFEEIPAN